MRILVFFILLIITYGCTIRNINYDRNKILKKYAINYETFVDNEKVELETTYLEKKNIKNVLINKKSKHLIINQFKRVELFELKNLNLDSLSAGRRGWDKKKISLLVIDGIVIIDSLKNKIKLDPNAIKSFEILSEDKMNDMTHRRFDGDVLVITTK